MKNRIGKQFIFTIIITLVALVSMVAINFVSFYNKASDDMIALGKSNLSQESEKLNNYLLKGMDVLQVTTISVEYMMKNGNSSKDIEEFLVEQSERYKEDIDANFTGIYGYFNGDYIDGIGWVPDADYVPQEREWYIAAVKGNGKPVIVSPYLDAQTNTIMVSVSQLLYDGESVISLDIVMDEIQILTENINFDGMGYGFVIDKEGLVVAHSDEEQKGQNYQQQSGMNELTEIIYRGQSDAFDITINGERCTVFTDVIMDDWYVAMIVSNTKLFHDVREMIIRDVVISVVVFLIILVFCSITFYRLRWHMQKLEESRAEKDKLNELVMQALARTIDAKDRYTNGHSQRVAKYAREIARRMGKSESEVRDIYYAGLLHDVGKIHVPDEIISKPSRLTKEEFGYIKLHPIAGFHILKDMKDNPLISQGAKWHHEKYGGGGYPNGLVGENIPEIARIIGVADAYDAMTSYRSYRDVLPQEAVRAELIKGSGTQFDPDIVNIMVEMIDEDTEYALCQKTEFKKKVLIVDDEPMDIDFIKYILKDEPQYEIYCESTGAEALKSVAKYGIDIMLLDIQMPDMDGFQVYLRLRETSNIPVIFMSVNKDLATIEKAQRLGVEDYIVKPFLPQELLEIIHNVTQSSE
ncbi:MAG: response regulator [Clostridium sp.]|nr:response regulator [Clostridium sp.]MCM1399471.1 response regulator [Clostridium sp.]MCM1460025.1 response regulator [Bacteroides sp.]